MAHTHFTRRRIGSLFVWFSNLADWLLCALQLRDGEVVWSERVKSIEFSNIHSKYLPCFADSSVCIHRIWRMLFASIWLWLPLQTSRNKMEKKRKMKTKCSNWWYCTCTAYFGKYIGTPMYLGWPWTSLKWKCREQRKTVLSPTSSNVWWHRIILIQSFRRLRFNGKLRMHEIHSVETKCRTWIRWIRSELMPQYSRDKLNRVVCSSTIISASFNFTTAFSFHWKSGKYEK